MDNQNLPKGDTRISAHDLAKMHLQALQRLRDETLLLYAALESVSPDELRSKYASWPRLIKDAPASFDQAYRSARLSIARMALRRVLQMNSFLLAGFFPELRESPSTPTTQGKGMVAGFRERLRQIGANETPAAVLGSLAALERLLGAKQDERTQASPKETPGNVDLILVEPHAPQEAAAPLEIKPWQFTIRPGEFPEINERLLESIFATAIVVAHEAVKAGEAAAKKG